MADPAKIEAATYARFVRSIQGKRGDAPPEVGLDWTSGWPQVEPKITSADQF